MATAGPDPGSTKLERMDPKTALNHFCQRYTQRPVTKADIEYDVKRYGQMYQAIVTLNCINGERYAGESMPCPKEAEKAAAQQAILAHSDTLAGLMAKSSKDTGKKRKDGSAGTTTAENPALTPKVKLNTLCMRLSRGFLKKGETVFTTNQVIGGFQATVTISSLPGEWAKKVWAGEVCSSKQAAEQSAASIILAQIEADEDLTKMARSFVFDGKSRQVKGIGKGKGDGKGACAAGSARGQRPPASWGWMPQFPPTHYDARWYSGASLPRETITEEMATGEVLEWLGRYGWIRPHSPPDHPAARLRDGKIYVTKQDLASTESVSEQTDGDQSQSGRIRELQKGQIVKFHIYADPRGLGATEVSVAQIV
eukprot:TRINITY_DN40427_c0_g1_i1.p1 TRINITY_DN40427_c0_g1~~TRINITY_DN40427_c0_g1_i1.p1  ORF type:complete len:384 (+),score=67.70 TRINITY_DN40427_c0_g1_i1:51-1154(+)